MKKTILFGQRLTNANMKRVIGGSSVEGELETGEPPLGTCCWHFRDWTLQHQCGLKKAEAISAANAYHAMWCCDSCPPNVW